jgi:hypothetical protein
MKVFVILTSLVLVLVTYYLAGLAGIALVYALTHLPNARHLRHPRYRLREQTLPPYRG